MILGTGIDIIEISRIQKAIDRWGDNFIRHVFNDEEIAYAQKNKFPIQHFAARFAAKEAIYKALDDKSHIGWKDITILNDQDGKPFCKITNYAKKNKIILSISHTENYAVANAIVTS